MFIAIAIAMMLAWDFIYVRPQQARMQAQQAQVQAQQTPQTPAAPAAPPLLTQQDALTQTAAMRVPVRTEAVTGSILLQGARLDDLQLRGYRETTDRDSPYVSLLEPNNSLHGYDAYFGWQDQTPTNHGVSEGDLWTAAPGQTLTPTTPVVLTYASGDGFEITRTISIDQNYMLTSTDVVRNASAQPRFLRPFGVVRRDGKPADYTARNVVQGFAGVFGTAQNSHLYTAAYPDAEKHANQRDQGKIPEGQHLSDQVGDGGWLGISDHYWLTAIVLPRSEHITAYFDARNRTEQPTDFRAAYLGQFRQIAPGQSITYTQRLFAGAKRVDLLRAYQHDSANPIPRFDEAVDWGNLMWPLTRPFFAMLDFLANQIGSRIWATYAFGIGILLTTIVIRLLFFPIMYSTQKSMAKMRVLGPKMKEIQERFAADPQRQQQEMMNLYKTEKINPITGCLPMFLQIPVFFALYKTLSVTIEMRHAPFFGWVRDLSAPDPAMIFNLFGLLPYDPHTVPIIGGVLAIGIWPILYGISMTGQQALSPPPADATQAQIFRLMPILFTLMLAGLPSGLLIYYTWSYSLLILQQYMIFRRQGIDTPFDQFMAKRFKRKDPPTTLERV